MREALIERARTVLPEWIGAGPLLAVPALALLAFVLAWLATSVAYLGYRGTPDEAHWSERARRAWPARSTASQLPFAMAVISGMIGGYVFAGPLSWLSGRALGLCIGVAVFLAAYPPLRFVDRRIMRRRLSWGAQLRAQGLVFAVMIPHFLIVLAAAIVMPREDVRAIAVVGAGTLLVLVWLGFAGGLRIAAALGLARPAPREVAERVERVAERVGHRPRAVWVLETVMVNAFAFGATDELAYTRGALDQLSAEELDAITLHELGHLTEGRAVITVRLLGVLSVLPLAFLVPAVGYLGPFGAIACAMITASLGIAQRMIARRMEHRADAVARDHEAEGGAYARALERVYELNLVPAVMPGRQVHPHLYDRLVEAGVTPSYPRPDPPAWWRARMPSLLAITALSLSLIALAVVAMIAPLGGDVPAAVGCAARGMPADCLDRVARAHEAHAEWRPALVLYGASAAIDCDAELWSHVASLGGRVGRCAEARLAYSESVRCVIAEGAREPSAEAAGDARLASEGCVPPPRRAE